MIFFWQGLDFLLPIAQEFNPDVVAVSAGFDAHQLDPLLQLNLSLKSYYQCGNWLRDHFNEVFAVLEGGYNLSVIPKAIKQFQQGCNGSGVISDEKATISDTRIKVMFDRNLDQLDQLLNEYWRL